ncbi:ABC transporter ATP-binding protein [Rhodobium gokarnense]|uniref:Branched-chain amino acid transport system ATP-binding protein n=1 Tax=Rhodobium gokarnense TaxID=364296 RepID=A0ABT3H916_9HYPH|nr:ABC transporter ATP-binding protein [Rhodobium gokarnense]MCW2306898.1 branched-chain amino acid transport system ATP-binding protein [Rhodobium gokarnense]
MSQLEIQNLSAAYGAASVLNDVSITAEEGKITCILGANGCGKTTLIRSILGLMPNVSGSIVFEGQALAGWPPHKRVRRGIGCVPEGRRVFPKMTVEENLRAGAFLLKDTADVSRGLKEVYEIFPRLAERRAQLAGTMSGGEQAMVSIGRALIGAPKLLLVDEPSLGLSPALVQDSFDVVKRINRTGKSVLLVEQNVHQTLEIADYGYVMSQGKVIVSGKSDDLHKNEEVRRAYFGAE